MLIDELKLFYEVAIIKFLVYLSLGILTKLIEHISSIS